MQVLNFLPFGLPVGHHCGAVLPAETLVDRHRSSRIIYNHPGGIEGAGKADQGIAIHRSRSRILVENTPENNGWMIAVPTDQLRDLAPSLFQQTRVVFDPSQTRLRIYQYPQPIGQFQESRWRRAE